MFDTMPWVVCSQSAGLWKMWEVGTKKCLSWRPCCLDPLLEQPLLFALLAASYTATRANPPFSSIPPLPNSAPNQDRSLHKALCYTTVGIGTKKKQKKTKQRYLLLGKQRQTHRDIGKSSGNLYDFFSLQCCTDTCLTNQYRLHSRSLLNCQFSCVEITFQQTLLRAAQIACASTGVATYSCLHFGLNIRTPNGLLRGQRSSRPPQLHKLNVFNISDPLLCIIYKVIAEEQWDICMHIQTEQFYHFKTTRKTERTVGVFSFSGDFWEVFSYL